MRTEREPGVSAIKQGQKGRPGPDPVGLRGLSFIFKTPGRLWSL